MNKIFLFLIICSVSYLWSQNVVINEVLYDPIGSDTGYEWIELYNDSDDVINLENWTIEKAGTSFSLVFIFPSINIQPHSFLLIGEEHVPNTDLIASLAFQNGGSETDGIRIISNDGSYTDTVLYDSPNTNNLPDDMYNPGIYFAPDVAAGNTLARKQDGQDTDNSEEDFFECEEPTPGTANFYPIDLAIYELQLVDNNGNYWLETEIHNLSTENVDNLEATLEITINSVFYESYDLPQIPAQSSISFTSDLGLFYENYNVTTVEVIYEFDNNLENNICSQSILIGESQLIINEILFRPASTNQEWLEIFNRGDCGYLVDNWRIIDAAGGVIRFSAHIQPGDFLVICQDAELMLETHPQIISDLVVEGESWTALNNTQESLILMDHLSVVFDSLHYTGSGCPPDYSIERVNPFDDENIEWLVCLDSLGTPTRQNSVLPIEKDLELNFRKILLEGEEIFHELTIANVGLENIDFFVLSVQRMNCENEEIIEDFVSEFNISDTLLVNFSTTQPQTGYYKFEYEIFSEEDMDSSNDFCHSFHNNQALPFVINEIMYAPSDDLPEWLEIIQNFPIIGLEKFYLVADNDTLCLPFFEEEYMLITSNTAAADTLQNLYDLSGVGIEYGLPSLSNNGEQLSLIDEFGNLIETFFYLPQWNDKMKGISIERINSLLPATENNWGPSVTQCTPGRQNSIFVQILPSQAKLTAEPNPFSPYRGEHTIFNYKLPEVISRVNLRIFDLKGRLVCKLINQELMAAEGGIVWNGRDDDNRNLPIGVYVALMQATARDTEKVYKKKTTVVIGK